MSTQRSTLPARQFMTRTIVSIMSEATVTYAANLMKKKGISSLIVGQEGKPAGIITERDMVRKILAEGESSAITIAEIMSTPLLYVNSHDSILDAADLMIENGIRKIAVKENNRVVGIITATDLLQLISALTEYDLRKVYQNFLVKIYDHELRPAEIIVV